MGDEYRKRIAKMVLITVCLLVIVGMAQSSTAQKDKVESDSPIGVWRGDSLCTTASSASCNNERVVYYIEAIAGKSDSVMIRADKIVDGKAITMGSGPWQYDRSKQTLSWQSGERLWLLIIKGRQIEGTLTVANGVIFRKMTLRRGD
jgi:hypothetical protein